jgi:cytochrome c-type biogenesis protein CcmE
LQGVVERGSIVEDGGDTDFVIGFNGVTIPVHYDGQPGGIFKECIAVVVHGRFDGSTRVFAGDRVEVKHSDEYVAVNDERLDEVGDIEDACEVGATA